MALIRLLSLAISLLWAAAAHALSPGAAAALLGGVPVPAVVGTPAGNSCSNVTSCAATPTLLGGDVMFVAVYAFAATIPSVSSGPSGTGIAGCQAVETNATTTDGGGNSWRAELWECSSVASGSPSVTVSWGATESFVQLQEWQASVVSKLQTAASNGTGGTGTAISISTSAAMSAPLNFAFLNIIWNGSSLTLPPGWNVLVNSTGTGWTVFYEVFPPGPLEVSTSQGSSTQWAAAIGVMN
jgi:hypothetical protein